MLDEADRLQRHFFDPGPSDNGVRGPYRSVV